jgi:hypothetical protein
MQADKEAFKLEAVGEPASQAKIIRIELTDHYDVIRVIKD